MRLTTILVMTVTLIALQNCSLDKPCLDQRVTYRINKIPQVNVKINNNGGMDRKNTKKVKRLVRNLRYVEDYYYNNSTETDLNKQGTNNGTK